MGVRYLELRSFIGSPLRPEVRVRKVSILAAEVDVSLRCPGGWSRREGVTWSLRTQQSFHLIRIAIADADFAVLSA